MCVVNAAAAIVSIEPGAEVFLWHVPSGEIVRGHVKEDYGNGLIDVTFRPHAAMDPAVVRTVRVFDHKPMAPMVYGEWAAWPALTPEGWRRAEDFVSELGARKARSFLRSAR